MTGTGNRTIKISYSGTLELDAIGTVTFQINKNGSGIGADACYVGVPADNYGEPVVFSRTFITSAVQNDYFELVYSSSGSATKLRLNNPVFNIEIIY
jgi:hypothetical protein